MQKQKLLIDGDLLLYKSACGVEKEVHWDEENHVLWSNVEDAWGCLQEHLERIFSEFAPDSPYVIALTGKTNFRKELYPEYKANRKGARKPLCYTSLVERLVTEYKTNLHEGIEADDVLGILATKPSDSKSIIVSEDKDMASVPATVYAKGECITYSKEQADYNHLYQTLTGDTSDNYPGVPGIGPVKAKKLLDDSKPADWWKVVVSAYTSKGLTEEDALLQARLARILRWEDWDESKQEPILWTPTNAS